MVNIKGFRAYTVNPSIVNEMPIEADDYLDFQLGQSIVRESDTFLKVNYPEFLFEEKFAKDHENRQDVLEEGKKNLQRFLKENKFIKQKEEMIYVYSQLWQGHEQTGFLLCVDNDDYTSGKIVPHEQTFSYKVDRLAKGAEVLGIFNSFPLAFGDFDAYCTEILERTVKNNKPHLQVTINDIDNRLYELEGAVVETLKTHFKELERLYIGDGHHRFKAYSEVVERMKKSGNIKEDQRYFPIVVYPMNKLQILSYHRYVKNVPNFSGLEFISKARKYFKIEEIVLNGKKSSAQKIVILEDYIRHDKKGYFVIFLNDLDKWFTLNVLPHTPKDIIDSIDVSYFSTKLFKEILGLNDLTSTKHFEFHYENREQFLMIEKCCKASKEINMAVVCPRIKLEEVQMVADAKLCMPPKSTFVYPKPIIGLLFKAFKNIETDDLTIEN